MFPTQKRTDTIKVTNTGPEKIRVAVRFRSLEQPLTDNFKFLTKTDELEAATPSNSRLVLEVGPNETNEVSFFVFAERAKGVVTRVGEIIFAASEQKLSIPIKVQVVEPKIVSPSTHYLPELGFKVYSIVKDGNKDQQYQLRIHNESVLDSNCKFQLPYNGENSSFLQYSILPSKVLIPKGENKLITIKVKVDLKKAGQNRLDDLMDELEMTPPSPQPEVSESDMYVNTLLNIAILETDLNIAIPVRILYKRPSKSKSLLGLAI